MKKLLFFATAAVVLASCNNDVTISENTALVGSNAQKEISLYAVNHTPKRAINRAPVQGTTFPTANTMEVKAYQSYKTAQAYFDKTTFASQEITTGVYKWRGWDGSAYAPKYWPMSEAVINFFAVSGAGVAAADITIANALASASVEYTAAKSYLPTTQSDIMYAFNRDSVKQTGNALTFPDDVDMTFKHALALINFQIKAGDAASQAIKIYKIELNGARYTGTLAITNTNAETRSAVWSAKVDWTPDAVVNNVKVSNIGNESEPVALTQAYVPTNANTETATDWASLMIIPSQQKDASPVSYGFTTFTIYYQLDGKDYTYTYAPAGWTDDDSNPATPDVASLTAVQAGYKYTYQITMTLHEILIDPVVEAWTEQNTANNVNI